VLYDIVVSKIDIDQLRKEIKEMNRWNVLYKALKEELSALNHWRDKPRGNPSKAGKTSWENRNKKVKVL
jgi:protein associated with RNAse G/E